MTTGFWIGAAVLALVAAAFVLIPLWRCRRAGAEWSLTGIAMAVLTVPAAVLMYNSLTTYSDTPRADVPGEQADMIAQLAERMAENPDDVAGWRLLGRSYMAIGEYAQARRAWTEAWNRSPAPDNALKLSMAEVMIFTDRSSIGGAASDLVEQVLNEEPGNQKALWYGGLVALEQGREDTALTRWRTLLDSNPPDEIAELLRRQIAGLTGSAPAAGSAARNVPAAADPAATDGPIVGIDVRLGDNVPRNAFGPQAALFIFARAGAGGPPVAVIREPLSAVPGQFTLSDANTMLAGRSLGDFDELTIVARVSASGQPTEQPGDYFAQAMYAPGVDDGTVELVIDQAVQ